MTRVPLHEIDIASATEPTLVIAGQLWYDSVAGKLKVYNGASFDEYCFVTDIDTRIAAHRIETNAHAASKISILDTVAFSSAVQLQGFIDDVGSQFYDRYIVEHNASGVHGPKVTISQSNNDNALAITRSGTGNTTVVAIDNVSSATALGITSNNTNARTALTINYTGVNRGLHVAAVSDLEGVLIQHSGLQKALRIDQSAYDNAVYVVQNGNTDAVDITVASTAGSAIETHLTSTANTHSALVINNSGSGLDIRGNSSNWTIDKYGNANFRSVTTLNGGPNPHLVYDTDWFPTVERNQIDVIHNAGSDLVFGTAMANLYEGGYAIPWSGPIMQSMHRDHVSAYVELNTNRIRFNRFNYLGAMNTFGGSAENNSYTYTGKMRYRVFNRTANYDSGWTGPVAINTTYTFTHGLGIYPHFICVELAQNSDGSGWRVPMMHNCTYSGGWYGSTICQITTSQVKVRTGSNLLAYFYSYAGADITPTSGYLRIRCYNWPPDFDSAADDGGAWSLLTNAVGSRDRIEWHNFGTVPSLINFYISDNASQGSQTWATVSLGCFAHSFTTAAMIYDIGPKQITIKGGLTCQTNFQRDGGTQTSPATAYYRILAWR